MHESNLDPVTPDLEDAPPEQATETPATEESSAPAPAPEAPPARLAEWTENVDGWVTQGFGPKTASAVRNVRRELVIPLTDSEKARLAEDLVEISEEEAELDAEIKRQKAEWKEAKESFAARRANKLGAVRTGKERRIVDAQEVFDHESGTHYVRMDGDATRYLERPMKEQEYLVGAPKLFVETTEPASQNTADATLVATSEDGKVTKLHGRKPRAKVSNSIDSDVSDVMRAERKRTKKDHTTT